jgi:purine-nucleoside/S-methyl-5'-thioadenosine phosphorylase / adenosine deaminase
MSLVERRFGCVLALVPSGVWGVVFTTRVGGVSAAPYASLNLGYSTGDAPDAVAANRRALSRALGIPPRWATARQVHGDRAVEACAQDRQGIPTRDADAIVTRDRRVPVVVLAADCVPIALVGTSASGVVHAGWRGLAEGAIASGVSAVRAAGVASGPSGLSGPSGPSGHEVRAWIGPCIGPCHYEVGPEVPEQVARSAPHAPAFTADIGGTTRFDLRAAARWLLEDAGATVADERFFSHRRDGGTTGRQAVIVWRDGRDA